MTEKSKLAFIIIWSFILLSYLIGLFEIIFVLVSVPFENVLSLLGTIASIILFLSFFVGFFLSYLMIGPWIFKKHGHKSFCESYIGLNVIFTESELKDLAGKVDDPSIVRTRKLISFSKYTIVISLILTILFFVLSG